MYRRRVLCDGPVRSHLAPPLLPRTSSLPSRRPPLCASNGACNAAVLGGARALRLRPELFLVAGSCCAVTAVVAGFGATTSLARLRAAAPASTAVEARCEEASVAAAELSSSVVFAPAALWRRSRGGRDWRWWLRALRRCIELIVLLAPVACIAPLCWLTWDGGGERVFWGLTLRALDAAGPTFIKFAQWVSTRPDMVPKRACLQLATLQTRVRPHLYAQTEATLAAAFGPDWAEALRLEPVPVGSGCMAQVHRGFLLPSSGGEVGALGTSVGSATVPGEGREVAVKVRHPGAREKIELDLDIMYAGADLLEGLWPAFRYLSISEAVDHFDAFLAPQVDMRVEAQNLDAFRRNFEYAKTGKGLPVRFPEVIQPYVAETVLVETYEHATPLSEVLARISCTEANSPASQVELDVSYVAGDSSSSSWATEQARQAAAAAEERIFVSNIRDHVSKVCMDAFMKMVFTDNFIHADMHPGNVLVRFPGDGSSSAAFRGAYGSGDEPEIVVLDAGLVVALSPQDRRNFVEVFHSIATNDASRTGRLMLERSPGDRSVVVDPEGFVAGVEELIGRMRGIGISLGKVRIGDILGQMLGLACAHRVKLETSFVTVCTSIIVFEGVGRQLDPMVDLLNLARPLLAEVVMSKLWLS